jgi:drug/metabolite transporter (DMT)-like permease
VFSVILGILILNEQMVTEQWIASAVVFCGILISRYGANRLKARQRRPHTVGN